MELIVVALLVVICLVQFMSIKIYEQNDFFVVDIPIIYSSKHIVFTINK